MSRFIGDELPEALRPLFEGSRLEEREGLTFLLLTSGEDGWPHLAMLSVGEVLALTPRDLRFALWIGSTATRNLTRQRRAVLALVHDGAGYYVHCTSEREEDLDLGSDGRLAFFTVRVAQVLEDVAPYARITSGISFRLNDPDQVVERWQRTVAAMRERG